MIKVTVTIDTKQGKHYDMLTECLSTLNENLSKEGVNMALSVIVEDVDFT